MGPGEWSTVYWISTLVFILVLAVIVRKDWKNMKRESILLIRKTQTGRRFLKRTGTSHPTFWKAVGVLGVVVGFMVSALTFYMLLMITLQSFITKPMVGMGLVLPSPFPTETIVPGVYGVPFWYWVIAIGLLALVHEGFHGIMAAREKVKIKSLGWGLLLILPFAFVEPDEKQLAKKKPWPQLRVFAAGSFANFLLAFILTGVAVLFVAAMFSPAGVVFQGYPSAQIDGSGITHILGSPVNGDAEGLLIGMGRDIVEVTVGGAVYYTRADIALDGIRNGSSIPAFEDYSPAKLNMTGIIISIEGEEVKDIAGLRAVLNTIGPNREITVVTTDLKEERTYTLLTKEEPDVGFEPSLNTYLFGALEHVLPGISDSFEASFNSIMAISGNKPFTGLRELKAKKGYWEFLADTYPALSSRAQAEADRLEAQIAEHPGGGFMGIISVDTYMAMAPAAEPYRGAVIFIYDLLKWVILINVGVGAFNLLPIGPLDGGRMWDILFRRISKKHGKRMMYVFSRFTLLMVLFNILMIFVMFLNPILHIF